MSQKTAELMIAVRARPSFPALIFAALPISQHLGVIALFLAVFHALLGDRLGAGEVGWTCVGVGLAAYVWRRVGWAKPHSEGGPNYDLADN